MQTILGAGGAIGNELAKELTSYTDKIRLVSRNPQKINENDELFPADLLDYEQVKNAVEGSDIVYLTAGLQYKAKAWEVQWPLLMDNVIEACKTHQAKLVFFDNVYMYDRDFLSHMTEETPVRPTSRKGKVRAKIADKLMTATQKGEVKGLIARSADFLGPFNSIPVEMIYNNFKKGKKAQWFLNENKIHTFTYTKDAAKGTAILGNSEEAFGQVWHLPTLHEKLTGKDWIQYFANEMNAQANYTVISKWLLSVLGIFIPFLREFKEMSYQYDRDYFFDSKKFEDQFSVKPLSASEAINDLLEDLKEKIR